MKAGSMDHVAFCEHVQDLHTTPGPGVAWNQQSVVAQDTVPGTPPPLNYYSPTTTTKLHVYETSKTVTRCPRMTKMP